MAAVPRPCRQCDTVFQPEGRSNRAFCTRECANVAMRRRVALECAECGRSYETKASALKKGAKFCSDACRVKNLRLTDQQYAANAERMSVERRGAGNPAFKHGRDGNRARLSHFSLKLKGEDRCRNCGSANGLQLHHVIPRSMFRGGRDEIMNGLPLCVHCHMSWHRRGRVTIYRDVFTPDEWGYLTSVNLTGQDVVAWLDDRYPERSHG